MGHSTLFKNNPVVNARYKTRVTNGIDYVTAYTSECSFAFDEVGMDNIYNELGINTYKNTIFANLKKYDYGFFSGPNA